MVSAPSQSDSPWNDPEVKQLLAKWQQRSRTNQLQHYEAAKYFDRAHRALGIPTVIMSAVVGTTVFASLQKQVSFQVQLAVGTISVLAAVLAGLQTFLRYSERAEKHRAVAASYAAIRHQIELLTHEPVDLRGSLKEFLDAIRSQIDSLAQSAPNTPESVWKRIQAVQGRPYFGSPGAAGGVFPAAPIAHSAGQATEASAPPSPDPYEP